MASKRFYWIKLKQSFYESNDAIDFLMSQSDGHGAKYVVLYQMLCLKTANNGGGMYSQMGEMIVPYDVDKIVRDCKYFERYIVTNALLLYKTLGLVYEQKDGGYLAISDIESMIGRESDSAERVRRHRNGTKALHCNAHSNATVTPKVTTELDIERDIDIDTPVVVSIARTRAREAFVNAYAMIDDDTTTDGIDFDELSRAYSESEKFLQTHPAAKSMVWAVKNYAAIVAGKYKDYTPPPENGTNGHAEELGDFSRLFTIITESDDE